ncbi:UDP-glucose dehydrogenase family protein [Paenibacillus ferrarius]|uniref:UDP-glucose dehydrogenase family protein n=1 Tax=Paenibacillus ferrarius TaxID=1469647 RepID=UPI003D2E7EA0
MSILIIGTGYVGVTTALVFAELGFEVTGLDADERKVQTLSEGKLTFYEPGLQDLLDQHLAAGRIRFTSEAKQAIRQNTILFLCVGTPSDENGSADLRYIRAVAEQIGQSMDDYKVIVIKSTVPIHTNERLTAWIAEAQPHPIPFDVVSNPEFLREGSALQDALHPDRIIIGSRNQAAGLHIQSLYENLNAPCFLTTPTTAEMIKYASNSFLATKISFANELARLCEQLDINVGDVSIGMGYDHRIGPHFLKAGIGYGGSCFPKDIKALLHIAKEQHTRLSILEQVHEVNETQVEHFLQLWERKIGGFAGKRIAILGLSFKPNTDDLREAPSLAVIRYLTSQRAQVRVHDPVAKLPASLQSAGVRQLEHLEDAVAGCDAAIMCSEWDVYRNADWEQLRDEFKQLNIFDGRNVLDRQRLTELGYTYSGIGNAARN